MSLKALKATATKRATGLCEYCKSPANISSQPFVMEHIIPKSKGGATILENIAYSCQGCNNHKYNKTEGLDVATGNRVPLFNPRQQRWDANFQWSANGLEIIGMSSCGRATVGTLKLNRSELKSLRKLLTHFGSHPPPSV